MTFFPSAICGYKLQLDQGGMPLSRLHGQGPNAPLGGVVPALNSAGLGSPLIRSAPDSLSSKTSNFWRAINVHNTRQTPQACEQCGWQAVSKARGGRAGGRAGGRSRWSGRGPAAGPAAGPPCLPAAEGRPRRAPATPGPVARLHSPRGAASRSRAGCKHVGGVDSGKRARFTPRQVQGTCFGREALAQM